MGNLNVSSNGSAQEAVDEQIVDQEATVVKKEMDITTSIEDLQTDEQRRVLDTVAQVRKCGLESILSLPQLVVCGDQSAGKSSVLEALTEIPFPRSDNLCTRFATEIILRRATTNSLTIKIIPDAKRPSHEQTSIKAFEESITDFGELPRIMAAAKAVMDDGSTTRSSSATKAFARDVLSIDIGGPSRPQLTLVDIPGLIQTNTKEVTKADVELVAEITDQYISQPRTICLAVVSAAYDCANQKILTKVRQVDPDGDRTLGIITKPDMLPEGSGTEASFLELARNEDIFFRLGWHVLKNRKFVERGCSLADRNDSEDKYFRTSNFKTLPDSNRGINALRSRLSVLLFEHVKRELPKLRTDLEEAMSTARKELKVMGKARTSVPDCKAYLTQLSLDYNEVCKAAVEGHYEGSYFTTDASHGFDLASPATIRRIRAVVQFANTAFANTHLINGHKYQIDPSGDTIVSSTSTVFDTESKPLPMNKTKAIAWVRSVLVRTRGKELIGNFNPLLVGELFWEQCSKWHRLAIDYLDVIAALCSRFLDNLLEDKCPKDMISRLKVNLVQDALKSRYDNAMEELDKIMEDIRSYPINYNHYYTDTIIKRREDRQKESLTKCINDATSHEHLDGCHSKHTSASIDVERALSNYSQAIDPNMENVSCEEALDCLYAIYKVSTCQSTQSMYSLTLSLYQVQQKTFVANITTQVFERHIIRGLEKIFSPVTVVQLSDQQVAAIASEPAAAQRQRKFLEDRIGKLGEGQKIFRGVMGSATS